MGMTDIITYFSFEACVSARLNSLNSLFKNFNGEREGRGYASF
jgi:hypothetical protein